VGHHVDGHCDGQDQHVVLVRVDGHAVGIAHPEPLLRALRDLFPSFPDTA
jgi:hypothetical protein